MLIGTTYCNYVVIATDTLPYTTAVKYDKIPGNHFVIRNCWRMAAYLAQEYGCWHVRISGTWAGGVVDDGK